MSSTDSTESRGSGSTQSRVGGSGDSLTRLLHAVEEGPVEVREQAWRRLYPELLRIASLQRHRWRGDWTLDTRALASEAYMRFFGPGAVHFESRRHFFLAVARGVRRILINYSAEKHAAKRGGSRVRVSSPATADFGTTDSPSLELAALSEALARLEAMDPRASEIVQLRFFVGLSEEETAAVLGLSRSTVSRDWGAARAWLWRELSEGSPDDGGSDA